MKGKDNKTRTTFIDAHEENIDSNLLLQQSVLFI